MATTQPVLAQCGGCHEKLLSEASAARYRHTPVTADKACVACHTPHAGNLAKLVNTTSDKLCMNCHREDQKAAGGRVVAALSELNDPHATRHGGIKDGSCAGCHGAHGGNRQLFLSKNYSSIFYQRFAPAQYELCFSCHDSKMVTETTTAKLTAFRNGEKNLHALHVRDTRERGENCRVCHATHAAAGPGGAVLIHDIVRYGTWQMPVRYAKTPSGGSCYPGCHPTYGYDREHAVKNVVGTPTTRSVMPISRERPATIALDATDANGTSVMIPGGTGPTVIEVVRTDQPQTASALDLLATSLKDHATTRVIVVLTGPGADRQIKPLAASRTGWFCLADADASLSAELDVHASPMTLVVRADGAEIARIAGAPESLALKLPLYIDLAAGKLDAAAAQQKLTTRPTALDESDRPPARDVRTVEFLLDTGKPAEALKLLAKLPDAAAPNWRYNLLGARALFALGRFADAKDAAEAALKQNANPPCLAGAHYLLGQIAEHDKDWARAAAEYRAAANANKN